MKKIMLCNASLKDLLNVTKLLRQLFRSKKIRMRDVRESLEDKKVIVAKQGRRVIGLISFTVFLKAKLVYISELVVDKKLHNRGIGKKLLNKTVQVAKQHSCNLLFLFCGRKRKKAHIFYLKNGFKKIDVFTYLFYKRVGI